MLIKTKPGIKRKRGERKIQKYKNGNKKESGEVTEVIELDCRRDGKGRIKK